MESVICPPAFLKYFPPLTSDDDLYVFVHFWSNKTISSFNVNIRCHTSESFAIFKFLTIDDSISLADSH